MTNRKIDLKIKINEMLKKDTKNQLKKRNN